ncbi:MAG: hypothetical protein ACTSRS_18000 [Candidatus Helarchaeota archaeon]
MQSTSERTERFPSIERYFIIIACLFIWILIQSPVFRYVGMDLQMFRLYNDVIGNLMLAIAMILIILPSKNSFYAALLLGLLSMGMDALLEMVINPLFGWYKPGGGAGTILPTVVEGWYIPYEMVLGFFAMGIVVGAFTNFPNAVRTSWVGKLLIIRQLFPSKPNGHFVP